MSPALPARGSTRSDEGADTFEPPETPISSATPRFGRRRFLLVPSLPASALLSGHHRDTINQILRHPVGHNIDWQSIVSLLKAIAVVKTHNGKLLVTLANETETFEPPKGKDIVAQRVVDLRRMLRGAGYMIGKEAGSASSKPVRDA
jgi:hypothetical protein